MDDISHVSADAHQTCTSHRTGAIAYTVFVYGRIQGVGVTAYLQLTEEVGPNVASFPGLPRFFCSSVSVDNGCGRAAKNGEGLVRFITCFMSSGRRGGVAQPQISLKTADEVV